MRLKYIIILITFCIITGINISYFNKEKKLNIYIDHLQEQLSLHKEILDKKTNDLNLKLEYEDKVISRNTILKNESGKEIKLEDITDSKPILFLRFSTLTCQSCLNNNIKLVQQIFDRIGSNKLILLTKNNNMKDIYQFKRINSIKSEVYKFDGIICPIDTIITPYFFCLTNDSRIHNIFIPREFDINQTKSYLVNTKNYITK